MALGLGREDDEIIGAGGLQERLFNGRGREARRRGVWTQDGQRVRLKSNQDQLCIFGGGHLSGGLQDSPVAEMYAVEIPDGDDGFFGYFEQAVYAVENLHLAQVYPQGGFLGPR